MSRFLEELGDIAHTFFPLDGTVWSKKRLVIRKFARTLISNAVQAAVMSLETGPNSTFPAFSTSTSTAIPAAAIDCHVDSILGKEVISQAKVVMTVSLLLRTALSLSAATRSASWRRPRIMTREAPALAKAEAMAKPIPSDPPVTNTVRPTCEFSGPLDEMVGYEVVRNFCVKVAIVHASRGVHGWCWLQLEEGAEVTIVYSYLLTTETSGLFIHGISQGHAYNRSIPTYLPMGLSLGHRLCDRLIHEHSSHPELSTVLFQARCKIYYRPRKIRG